MRVRDVADPAVTLARATNRRGRRLLRRIRYGGRDQQHWVRVVMDREVDRLIASIGPENADVIEVSGRARAHHSWNSYRSVSYPDFDLLAPTDVGDFDVVICEQVLEHVDDPNTAAATLASLCRPGGHVIVSTPFMLRIHPAPADNWRFTPDGLRLLLEGAGLTVNQVDSWGNSSCIRANRAEWAAFRPWHRAARRWALRNDADLPQVVWTMAERPLDRP